MRQYPFQSLRRLFVAVCAIVAAAVLTGGAAQPAFAQAGGIDETTQKLFDAIHANDYAAAQTAVDDGARVDVPGRWGMTAIELAIDKGYFKIAHYLVAVRNFRGDDDDSKSKRVATPSAPEQGSQGGPPPTQAAGAQPVAPGVGAVTTSPGAPGPDSAVASPFAVPSQPVGTLTDQPFYAPLAELETTAGRDAEADGPAWPAGKPNPFDPEMPAVGSNLQVIGEIGSASPGIALRPGGDFGQPALETESLPSLDASSPQSAVEAPDESSVSSGETKDGSGFGGGVIGETRDFE